jgi:PAS domain S-box-containing protein
MGQYIATATRSSDLAVYHAAFELASDAIIIFDPDTEEVLHVNRKACELYGFSREEFIGIDLKKLSLTRSKEAPR